MNKHPLADYVRILARGKNASRNMTFDEARFTMQTMLADDYEPEQLGAILMLLRVLEESEEEVAGFSAAINEFWPAGAEKFDLVWSSYAGKRRQPMWWILSAKLLTQMGYRILIHGTLSHTEGRIYAHEVCDSLGIPSVTRDNLINCKESLAYLPCAEIHPKLQEWLGLKSILGVRSPINTVLKTIAPASVPSVQGIFHPTYRELHAQAAKITQDNAIVIKGEGGEFEVNPERKCVANYCINGQLGILEIPNRKSHYEDKPEGIEPELLTDFMTGRFDSEYAIQAIINTAALALCAIRKTSDLTQSLHESEAYFNTWANNNF